jgi:TRAP-type transport system periplasmic protein
MSRPSLWRIVTAGGGAFLALALTSEIGRAQAELRIAHNISTDSHWQDGAVAFSAKISECTNGKYTGKIFPDGKLGAERQLVELVQSGNLDVAVVSTGPVGNFVPETLVFDIPFLLRDYKHAHAVLDGPLGQQILDQFPKSNLIALAWGQNGFRNLTNSKRPVRAPQDAQGLRIRTMENQVHMDAFRALGIQPIPIPFTELYPALEHGQVDGEENPIGVIVQAKLYNVQKYLSMTQHVYSPGVILLSTKVWDGLSDHEKSCFKSAAQFAAEVTRERSYKDALQGMAELRQLGMTIVEDVDRAAFEAALAPTYDEFVKKFGKEQIDAIRNYKY